MSVINKILKKSDEQKSRPILPVNHPPKQMPPKKLEAKIQLVKKTDLSSQQKKCGPCSKCQSPVFWFSKGGTGPHCIDCEFPSSNLLIRKIVAFAKNQDGSFRIFPIGDFPSLGIPPLPASEQRFEHSLALDAAGQHSHSVGELGNQLGNQISNPADNLTDFQDPDGCLHIRVARFERDRTLQRPDETCEEYEKRMQAGHEIAMHGETLKNYHQQSQQLPIQKNHIQKK